MAASTPCQRAVALQEQDLRSGSCNRFRTRSSARPAKCDAAHGDGQARQFVPNVSEHGSRDVGERIGDSRCCHDASRRNGVVAIGSSVFGVVGREDGWIAPADLRTMAAAMPDCRLITVPGIGHSMNFKSLSTPDILAHGSAGCPGVRSRSKLRLEVQFRQPHPIQQHDLPLRLAEEAKDAHAVKM